MERGYTKNYRRRIDHPLYKRPLVWHFFDYCIGRANFKDVEIDFNGSPIKLNRGSFVMSIRAAEKETGLTIQNIRTSIKILIKHGMLEKSTHELTQQATLITVCNYETYQVKDKATNTVTNTGPTHGQHSGNTGLTTDKNEQELIRINKKITTRAEPKKKSYSSAFLKLWESYPNTKGSKYATYNNYKSSKKNLILSDDQVYEACMNSVKKQENENGGANGVYYYQLSNLLGQKYSNDLPDLISHNGKLVNTGKAQEDIEFDETFNDML